jgi:ribosome-associated translation inhibitor RaiA
MAAFVDITFRSMDPSPAVETAVRTWSSRLDQLFEDIDRVAVVIEVPHRHRRLGRTFEAHVRVTIPERTIAITRDGDTIYVALADAFRAARRTLRDHVRVRRGEVKLHA